MAKWSKRALALTVVAIAAPLTAQDAPDWNETNPVVYRASPRVRLQDGIVFARYPGRDLKLDVYQPRHAGGARRPAVVIISGGSWTANDRKGPALLASALAERGVLAVSIEYRSAREAKFPAAVQDLKAAVRWLRRNADRQCIDPAAIGVMGGSSGGNLALLAGLSRDRDFEGSGGSEGTSSEVQAIIAMGAPTDITRLTPRGIAVAQRFVGQAPEADPVGWRRASPINHLDPADPPILLLHSAIDRAVPIEQAERLIAAYGGMRGRAELRTYSDAPHAFWAYAPWHAEAMDAAARFMLRLSGSTGAGRARC